jgi:hypothetical protein
MVTGMGAPFSRVGRSNRGGQADFELWQSSVEPLPVGRRQDRTTVLEPTPPEWQRGLWSDLPAPWTLRLQTQGSYPDSISRRRVVEVPSAFGLPLAALAALAVDTALGALDLGGGPLQRGADLICLQLGHRPLLPLGRLPAPLAQPSGDHHPVALRQGVGQVLGSIIPSLSRPQSLDRYAFVENDPINYTDPSGHMRMDIERRKDAASRSYFSANSNCGPLVTCVYNRPGLMVQEIYGWDTETGEFQKRTIYSGGLGPDGTWDFSEISDVTSYGRMGSDPPTGHNGSARQAPHQSPPYRKPIRPN